MRTLKLFTVCLALAVAPACVKTKVTTKTAGGAEATDVPTSKLGHYATADGFIGFTLDRTGEVPKFQLDNTSAVVALFIEDALDRGNQVGHFLNGPDGRAWLFISTAGDFFFISAEKRGELAAGDVKQVGVRVTRDGGATPLEAATQKGIATLLPLKTTFDLASEKLGELSVITKFPQFKKEDSGNLAKLEELLPLLDASLIVRVSAKGAESARWSPASPYIGDALHGLGGDVGGYTSETAWDKNAKGLAGHGGLLDVDVRYGSPSRLRLQRQKGWPTPLAAGTPGVIWMTDSTTIVFVSLDGGRYHLALTAAPDKDGLPVDFNAGSPSSWPAPLQHTLLDVNAVRGFAKGGAVSAKVGGDIEALDDAWWACVDKVWEAGRKDEDAIQAGPGGADAKQGKLSAVPKRYEEKAKKDCAPTKKKLEEGLLAFIEQRSKERAALYEKAKARVATLGVK